MLVEMPRGLMRQFGGKIIFPAVSRRQDLPRRQLRATIARNRRPLLVAGSIGTALMIGFGDLLVTGLWDTRYHEAGWMVSILALGLWPSVLQLTVAPGLRSIGQPQYATYANWGRLIFIAIALPAGYALAGLAGTVAAVALQSLLGYAIMLVGLIRTRLWCGHQDLLSTALFLSLLGGALLARFSFGLAPLWVASLFGAGVA